MILFMLKSCSYCAEEFLISELGIWQRKEKGQQIGMQKYECLESGNWNLIPWRTWDEILGSELAKVE